MFLIRLWHYLKGYVIIIVSGIFVERFVNICTRRDILLWDMERLDPNTIRMKISIAGFKKARTAARKSRCHVRITAKKGLPYLLGKYKKRRGFVFGLIFFVILIYLMTSIIWKIEIAGNSDVETQTIINQINDMGIYRGAAKRFVDPKRVADTLMLKNNELSWVGVEIKGTSLFISVKERIEPPALIPEDTPCDIVARRDGIILSIQAKDGLTMVKEGDTVIEGQLLISGNMESIHPEFGTMQVHAMGEVTARTWYELKREVPAKRIIRRRTGQEWNKYNICFLDFTLPLPAGTNPFLLYETGIYDRALVIGNRFRLPFGLTIQRCFELEEKEEILTREEARELAQETVVLELKKSIPKEAEIVDEQMQLISEKDSEYITITVECIENIAMEHKIGGD